MYTTVTLVPRISRLTVTFYVNSLGLVSAVFPTPPKPTAPFLKPGVYAQRPAHLLPEDKNSFHQEKRPEAFFPVPEVFTFDTEPESHLQHALPPPAMPRAGSSAGQGPPGRAPGCHSHADRSVSTQHAHSCPHTHPPTHSL